MRDRKHISLKTKLAAALCHMLRVDESGNLVRIIPHQEAVSLSADEIISRFHFDHDPIPHAEDGPDEPWNLPPRVKADHLAKTSKVDIPRIAKNKRVARAHAAHIETMAAKGSPNTCAKKVTTRFKSRPLPKGRRLTSRKAS